MSIGIVTTTLQRRSPTWEQTLAVGVTKDDLNEIAFEAGWRGIAGITAYTIDGQTYEVTVLKFVKVAELQEDMGLPILVTRLGWQTAFISRKGLGTHHYTNDTIDATIVPVPYSDRANATKFNCLIGEAEMPEECQTAKAVTDYLMENNIDPNSGWR